MSETAQVGTASGQEQDNVLEIRNARVTFDMGRGRARVLDDIDVDIERGEVFGIVGESGSGKSTFGLSLMDAVEDPGQLSGSIRYYPEPDSEPVDILELSSRELRRLRWEEISMVSQESMNAFNPTISVRRHFIDTFSAHNVDIDEGMEQAREVMPDLDLDPDQILNAHQHELSGGQKQRAMLALSLVFEPEVLILDEPTAGLDLLVQRRILDLLQDVKEEYDLTLVFITHNTPIISGLADRLAVMYAFDFVERGPARDVLLSPQHPYTRLLTQSHQGMDGEIEDVQKLTGDTPDPINVPSGCPFHPRCPIADDRCEVEEVDLRSPEGSDHEVACFYPDLAVEQIRNPMADEEASR